MIEVKQISKRYGAIEALHDVSFTAEKGKILGFLGPNGAGKSTTMNIITGYLSPSSGSVVVGGHSLLHEPRQAKALIGYLPEIPPLYTEMTVWEYLDFIYELKRVEAPRRKHLEEICEKVMLLDVKGRLIKNLSKGYQQRVGLAQALVGDPPVLILDEPTIGLDPQQIREVRSLIKQLGEKHTVLLSSHILPEIQAMCDRVLILNKGRIVADGMPDSLSSTLSGGSRLLTQIKGEPSKVQGLLSSVEGVREIQRGIQVQPGVWEYTLTLREGADPRQALFEALAQARMPLLEMRLDRMTLEEIFLRLTAGDPAQEGQDTQETEGKEEENL